MKQLQSDFDKDFNFAIHHDLILTYFEGFDVIEKQPDLTSFVPKYLTYYDKEGLESYFDEAQDTFHDLMISETISQHVDMAENDQPQQEPDKVMETSCSLATDSVDTSSYLFEILVQMF